MASFSIKELQKVPGHCSSQSSCDRLHGVDDCLLSDFIDFPQCSLEIQPEHSYSLDLDFKTETDLWDNLRFDASAEYRCCIDDKVDGNFFKYLSADPLNEENDCSDSVLTTHEMSLTDDFESFAVNTTTVDVLDYLEDAEQSFNMINSSSKHNACCKRDLLLSRREYLSEMENNSELIDERSLCQSASSYMDMLQSINSHNWSTKDTQMEFTVGQSNTFDTAWTFDKKEITEKTEVSIASSQTGQTNWSYMPQQNQTNVSVEQLYNGFKHTPSVTENILTRHSAVTGNTSSLDIIAADECESAHFQQHKNTVELCFSQSDSKSVCNLHLQNGQSVHERKEAEPLVFTQTTAHSVQLPYSSDMNINLHNLGSEFPDVTTILPLSSNKSTAVEDIGNTNLDKHNPARISNSSCSDAQITKPHNDKQVLVSKKKTYMNVGKRGRFVSVPVEKVNKLMVRDLLTMSGNSEKLGIKELTQEYRDNLHKIIEQKRKRLNNDRVLSS